MRLVGIHLPWFWLVAALAATPAGLAITLSGGASPYPNLLTGATDSTFVIGGSGAAGNAAGICDRLAGRDEHQGGARLTASGGITGVYQFTQGAPFTVGTVVTLQGTNAGFSTDRPWSLKLDGVTMQTGPGTRDTRPFQIATLAAPVAATQLRIEETMSLWGGSPPTTYAEVQELFLFADRLQAVNTTVTSVSATSYGSSAGLVDFLSQSNAAADSGWWASGGVDHWAILDLGGNKVLDGLILSAWENVSAGYQVQTGDGIGPWTTVVTVGMNAGDIEAIRFNTPQTTPKLRFFFPSASNPNGAGLLDIIPLVAAPVIPEPSTALLLAGVAAAALRRRPLQVRGR